LIWSRKFFDGRVRTERRKGARVGRSVTAVLRQRWWRPDTLYAAARFPYNPCTLSDHLHASEEGSGTEQYSIAVITVEEAAFPELRRALGSTNPIESCLSTVERVARNVKRWQRVARVKDALFESGLILSMTP
jgi:hypothetical protein